MFGPALIVTTVPPEQREIDRADQLAFEDRTARVPCGRETTNSPSRGEHEQRCERAVNQVYALFTLYRAWHRV